MTKIKVLELFGGIGGFTTALNQASNKYEIVDYIEKNEKSVKTYNHLFNNNYLPRDITNLETDDIKDHNLLVAGFPCPSFSKAGKRKGFEDKRGQMFFEIIRVAKNKQPEMMLLENVRGILSNNDRQTIQQVIEELNKTGYYVDFRLLNSKQFGVPQNRSRVFFTCIRADLITKGHFDDIITGIIYENILEDLENSEETSINKIIGEEIEGMINPKIFNSVIPEHIIEKYSKEKKQTQLFEEPEQPDYPVSKQMEKHAKQVCQTLHISGEAIDNINNPEDMKLIPVLKLITEKEKWEEYLKQLKNILTEHKVKTYYGRGRNKETAKKTNRIRDVIYTLESGENTNTQPRTNTRTESSQEILPIERRFQETDTEKHRKSTETIHPNIPEIGQAERIYSPQGNSPALNDGWTPKVAPVMTPGYKEKSQNKKSQIGSRDGSMFTIDSSVVHGVKIGNQIRELTPRECWRLQGFSDQQFQKAEEIHTDRQLYKQIGRAVTVPVVKEIVENIAERNLWKHV